MNTLFRDLNILPDKIEYRNKVFKFVEKEPSKMEFPIYGWNYRKDLLVFEDIGWECFRPEDTLCLSEFWYKVSIGEIKII